MLSGMSLFKRDEKLDAKRFAQLFIKQKLANALHENHCKHKLSGLVAVRLLGKNHIIDPVKYQSRLIKRKFDAAIRHWNIYLASADRKDNLQFQLACLKRIISIIEPISAEANKYNLLYDHVTSLYKTLQAESDISWFENEIAQEEAVLIDKVARGKSAHLQYFRIAIFNEKLAHRYEALERYDLQKTALLVAIEYLKLGDVKNEHHDIMAALHQSLNRVNDMLEIEAVIPFRVGN